MGWYYKDGDQEIGPVSKAELQQLIKTKKVNAKTLVRSVESDRWHPLVELVRGKTQAKQSPAAPPPPPAHGRPEADEYTEETSGRASGAESPAAGFRADEGDDTARAVHGTQKTEAPPTAVCSQCGRSFPRDQVVTYDDQVICAACKPLFVQKLREGAILPTNENYAGFWIRVGAKLIDSLIIFVIYLFIIIPAYLYVFMDIQKNMENFNVNQLFAVITLVIAATIFLQAAYTIWFVGRFGATLGKMACGLKVVLPGGGKASYMRATGRFFGEWVTQLTFTIGYIIAAFDNEKRALHDHICGTRVVRK